MGLFSNYINITSLMYGIVAVLSAGLIAYALTPPVRVLAYIIGAIDIPLDARRVHKKPTPRIGGLAIFLSFTICTFIFCSPSDDLMAIWLGGLILVVLGILDDVYRLSAWMKLIIQIGAAALAVYFGVVIDHITLFGNVVEFGVFSIPLTMLWIVGLTNAVNLIDGLDGLACGVSIITSISIFAVALIAGEYVVALITAILAGACIGFFPFNHNPARIFMGDTGALFLGYTLSIISVTGVFKLNAALSFIMPLMVFALPLCDTAVAILRRVAAGHSPFAPDRGHLHHKLVDMGFTQKEAVRILYAVCALLGLVSVTFTNEIFEESRFFKSILLFCVAMLIFVLLYIIMKKTSTRVLSGLTDHGYEPVHHEKDGLPEEKTDAKTDEKSEEKTGEANGTAPEQPDNSDAANDSKTN